MTSETRYILANRPTDEFQVILPRVQVGPPHCDSPLVVLPFLIAVWRVCSHSFYRQLLAVVLVSHASQDVEYSVTHRGKHFYITLRDKVKPLFWSHADSCAQLVNK